LVSLYSCINQFLWLLALTAFYIVLVFDDPLPAELKCNTFLSGVFKNNGPCVHANGWEEFKNKQENLWNPQSQTRFPIQATVFYVAIVIFASSYEFFAQRGGKDRAQGRMFLPSEWQIRLVFYFNFDLLIRNWYFTWRPTPSLYIFF